MGNSHFDSDIRPVGSDETIRGFATISATALRGTLTGDVTGNVTGNLTGNLVGNIVGNVTGDVTGSLTGDSVTASILDARGGNERYIRLGSSEPYVYIIYGGDLAADYTSASIVAAAADVDASNRGSIVLAPPLANPISTGNPLLWFCNTDTSATAFVWAGLGGD